jgi:hypothetical protein
MPERMTINGETDPPPRYAYEVLRNETPLPRAFVVGGARELSSWSDFEQALANIDFRREVILDTDVLPAGPRSEFRGAQVVDTSPNRIVISADLDAPGYLVLSELAFPGWRARVNGMEIRPLKANMAFRAIPLPAGRHEVVFAFHPPGLMLGAGISAATLLLLLVSLVVKRTESVATEVHSLRRQCNPRAPSSGSCWR